ncbi:MAG TPA: hypothetical protein VFA12_14825 [Stellaceae bacterium]|nr:hypothetical protein [Stellaceae bacterium]
MPLGFLPAAAVAGGLLFTPVPGPPPMPAYGAVNPSLSLSPPAQTPIGQQIQQNYRTQLRSAQRELQQANPSGLSPQQLEINRLLNSDAAAPR